MDRDSTGKSGALPLCMVADCDDVVKLPLHKFLYIPRGLSADVDADLAHDRHCSRMNSPGFCTGAEHFVFVACQMAKDALSHLTSRGVSGAEKQNSFFSHYLEIKPVQDLKFVTKD